MRVQLAAASSGLFTPVVSCQSTLFVSRLQHLLLLTSSLLLYGLGVGTPSLETHLTTTCFFANVHLCSSGAQGRSATESWCSRPASSEAKLRLAAPPPASSLALRFRSDLSLSFKRIRPSSKRIRPSSNLSRSNQPSFQAFRYEAPQQQELSALLAQLHQPIDEGNKTHTTYRCAEGLLAAPNRVYGPGLRRSLVLDIVLGPMYN